MPFKSQAQRRWMFANEPQVAQRWAKETPKGAKLPPRVPARAKHNKAGGK